MPIVIAHTMLVMDTCMVHGHVCGRTGRQALLYTVVHIQNWLAPIGMFCVNSAILASIDASTVATSSADSRGSSTVSTEAPSQVLLPVLHLLQWPVMCLSDVYCPQ